MIYKLHPQDRVPIRIQSKKSCLRLIFLHRVCLRRILSTINLAFCAFWSFKNLVRGPFDFNILFGLPIYWYWIWFEVKYSVITTIDWCCFYYFLRNSLVALLEALFARNTTCKQKTIKKCQVTNPLLEQTSRDTSWNRTTPIQFHKSL